MCLSGLCFFFQAEDGIRDADVTGVQTCALPIFARVEPHPPCHQLGHALRCHAGSEASLGGRPAALPARVRSATWAPWLVSSYSRRRGRPSAAAAASSHREVSRPNASSRLKALYRVPWAVKERDSLCSRMV